MWLVQADELELGPRQHPRAPPRAAAPPAEREPELLVLVRRRDVLVRVRLDADRHADAARARGRRRSAARSRDPVDLLERVDDDAADAGGERPARARRPTCCCRAGRCAPRGTPARSATASSPPVHTSRPRPSSATQRRDLRAQERLAGVVDVGRRRRTRRGSVAAAAGRGSRPRRARMRACRAPPRGRGRRPRRRAARRRRRARRRPPRRGEQLVDVAGGATSPGRRPTPP